MWVDDCKGDIASRNLYRPDLTTPTLPSRSSLFFLYMIRMQVPYRDVQLLLSTMLSPSTRVELASHVQFSVIFIALRMFKVSGA